MIGHLRGTLLYKRPPMLMLEVGGIGYEIEAPLSLFFDLPEAGAPLALYIHLVVREDAHILYGFANEEEKGLFRALLKVNGVGSKMALAILSGMSAEQFIYCVQQEDSASLVRIPGVGNKTAQRLIVEMRDRLATLTPITPTLPSSQPGRPAPFVRTLSPVSEAIEALQALGYKPAEATRLVKGIEGEGMSSEALIHAALKSAGLRG